MTNNYKFISIFLAVICIVLILIIASGGLKQMVFKCPEGYIPTEHYTPFGDAVQECVRENVGSAECMARCFGIYNFSDTADGWLEEVTTTLKSDRCYFERGDMVSTTYEHKELLGLNVAKCVEVIGIEEKYKCLVNIGNDTWINQYWLRHGQDCQEPLPNGRGLRPA